MDRGCRNESIAPAPQIVRLHRRISRIDEFVLQGTPQAFDEDIVQRAAAAIHADGDPTLLQ